MIIYIILFFFFDIIIILYIYSILYSLYIYSIFDLIKYSYSISIEFLFHILYYRIDMKLKKKKKNGRIFDIYIYISTAKIKMWKTKQRFFTMTLETDEKKRDVAQLGSAFVLGTKCHGFKSCHPYP